MVWATPLALLRRLIMASSRRCSATSTAAKSTSTSEAASGCCCFRRCCRCCCCCSAAIDSSCSVDPRAGAAAGVSAALPSHASAAPCAPLPPPGGPPPGAASTAGGAPCWGRSRKWSRRDLSWLRSISGAKRSTIARLLAGVSAFTVGMRRLGRSVRTQSLQGSGGRGRAGWATCGHAAVGRRSLQGCPGLGRQAAQGDARGSSVDPTLPRAP